MATDAADTTPAPSRSDRLHAIIAEVAPKAAAQHAKDGTWLTPPTETRPGAPYEIRTMPDGRRRLLVIGDDGDQVTGLGATLDDAIAAVEHKLQPAAAAAQE